MAQAPVGRELAAIHDARVVEHVSPFGNEDCCQGTAPTRNPAESSTHLSSANTNLGEQNNASRAVQNRPPPEGPLEEEEPLTLSIHISKYPPSLRSIAATNIIVPRTHSLASTSWSQKNFFRRHKIMVLTALSIFLTAGFIIGIVVASAVLPKDDVTGS